MQNLKLKIEKLLISVESEQAFIRQGQRKTQLQLRQQPLLAGIEKVVKDLRGIKAIEVKIRGATFSGTRQVIATVNTLAWALGIKVNGKKQMSAKYSAEPNITVAHS